MEKLFTDFNSVTVGSLPVGPCRDRPVIGLSVNMAEETSRIHRTYIRSVSDAGAVPILIPATRDADTLREIVGKIDGLILTGGADIGGEYFGEQTLEGLAEVDPARDAYDFLLLRLAADRQLPVLGICRGMQVINVAFGGTLWQDIPLQYPLTYLNHNVLTPRDKPVHTVRAAEDSMLARITGKTEFVVNSRHHQAVKSVGTGFRVSAVSPDGIAEAIEAYPSRRIMGVQWHPENMAAEAGCEEMKKLFRFFEREALLFRQAKNIHKESLTADSHCDTPMLFGEHDIDLGRRDPVAGVDLAKMAEGNLDAVFMAAYIPQGPLDRESRSLAEQKAVSLLGQVKEQVERNSRYAGQAVTFADADRLKAEGRRAVFLALENGYAIGTELEKLSKFRDMGVVYVTLCHNGANDICDSAVGAPKHGGLSAFGRELVLYMNRLGVVVDLSHAAETTFYDVLRLSSSPVICSHSSARALCGHPRNLTDDQIKALASAGGVIQVCLYGGFLTQGREATLADAVDHIDHIVGLVGPDYVGIGSDFDGGGGIEGCRGANEIINITVELLRRGYAEQDIKKILGGNLRRVVDAAQDVLSRSGGKSPLSGYAGD